MDYQTRCIIQALRRHEHIHPGGPRETADLYRCTGVRPMDRVLDVGCGFGGPAYWLREVASARVTGVDIVEENCIRCRKAGVPPLSVVQGDARQLPFREGSFDVVLSFCVLGQVDDKEAVLSEIRRVLRPGGSLGFDDYVVRDARRWRSGYPSNEHPYTEEDWIRSIQSVGFTLRNRQDLTASFRRDYQAFLVDLQRRRTMVVDTFGEEAVERAVGTFRAHVDAVLQGRKGGVRFVLARV
ncbi:MAG: methyltransferase domain-containing protein [Deltaproteobacteria bacterium]|nr:methyltransferase domain-containing protein [Deltaproteobacteria bacterium]